MEMWSICLAGTKPQPTDTIRLMKARIEEITKIPIIESVEVVPLDDTTIERLGPLSKTARENRKYINVFKIAYKSNGHTVVGFIIEPKKGTHLPCIIYNRGGTGDFGAIKIGELFVDLARIARQGYIVIATQYSGCGGSEGKDEHGGSDLNDVLNLKKILNKHPRADASHIGMFGYSRGGMMTYLALSHVSWIKAAITIGAPTNLIRSQKLRPEMREIYKESFGGSLKELKNRSAIFWSEKIHKKTPLLIMHGTKDDKVTPFDSIELSNQLQKIGKQHQLVMFEKGDHGLNNFTEQRNTYIDSWFKKYLKKIIV